MNHRLDQINLYQFITNSTNHCFLFPSKLSEFMELNPLDTEILSSLNVVLPLRISSSLVLLEDDYDNGGDWPETIGLLF